MLALPTYFHFIHKSDVGRLVSLCIINATKPSLKIQNVLRGASHSKHRFPVLCLALRHLLQRGCIQIGYGGHLRLCRSSRHWCGSPAAQTILDLTSFTKPPPSLCIDVQGFHVAKSDNQAGLLRHRMSIFSFYLTQKCTKEQVSGF